MPITNTTRRSRKTQTVVPMQDDLGRLQPQEPKFEQAILGALTYSLLQRNSIGKAS